MIAIIDYGAGNLTSVERAVSYLGFDGKITADAHTILSSEKVIFPGVGAAGATMDNLNAHRLADVLKTCYTSGKPMLGICIGIQILFDYSEEGDTECLGILPGIVDKFEATPQLKVPQIGWNEVHQTDSHPIFQGVPNPAHFYFVNSYYPIPAQPAVVIGKTTYGVDFCSVVARQNLIATQFHLEKSGRVGLRMLDNFLQCK
ncbi:MAG: imidazole glycerol phosphate synthase subunit HisH [Candidatus Poribacteria bacterium]|nr:imidazole glycerol phosphate synthase subunit HisH [Candidatus Poribacteria bacterium]MDE0506675.1 imidazole glycerol phosphate synthase subunit HisH [Candidatus Poribacteria bacterium]